MMSFGGQLPSFGGQQMRPMGQQMGGQQQMQSLGQMWAQQGQQHPPGQLPQMGQRPQMMPPQQMPGMVPGVPGSMGLNPGMGGPMQGQQWGADAQQHLQRFMQNPNFPSMMQDPRAQTFFQAHPLFQQMMSRMQGGQMSPMGA